MYTLRPILPTRTGEAEHVPPWVACRGCLSTLDFSDGVPAAYFRGEDGFCDTCGTEVDWLDALAKRTENRFDFHRFAPVQAVTTSFSVQLYAGRATGVELDRYEVPADARILGVYYRPSTDAADGSVPTAWPLEEHGNQPERWGFPRRFHVYGKPLVPKGNRPTHLDVDVTWVLPPDVAGWQLVDACHFLRTADDPRCIVAASTACEIGFDGLLEAFISKELVAKRRAKIDYASRLNSLLPHLVAEQGLRWLQPQAARLVDELRELRNAAVHTGKAPGDADARSGYLAAAVVAVSYTRFARKELHRRR